MKLKPFLELMKLIKEKSDTINPKLQIMMSLLVFLSFYPIMMILQATFFLANHEFSSGMAWLLSIYLGIVVGYGIRHQRTFIKRILICLTTIILALTQFLISLNLPLHSRLFSACSIVLFFIGGIGISLSKRNPTMNANGYKMQMIFLLIALSITYFDHKVTGLRNVTFIFAYLYMLIFVILQSQENLNNVFNQRSIQTLDVQRKIKSGNVKMILVFFACMLLLFNIKSIVLLLLHAAKIVVTKIIWLIMHMIGSSGSEYQNIDTPKSQPQLPDLGPSKKTIFPFIANVICALIAIFAVFKLAPIFIKKIREKFISLINILKKLFTHNTIISPESDGECFDYIEITKLSQPEMKKQKKERNKEWHKLQKLKHVSDPTEKIRLIYGIVLEKLSNHIPIKNSDTTDEIYQKSLEICTSARDLHKATQIYDRVRYGEKVPDSNDMADMENAYHIITGSQK